MVDTPQRRGVAAMPVRLKTLEVQGRTLRSQRLTRIGREVGIKACLLWIPVDEIHHCNARPDAYVEQMMLFR